MSIYALATSKLHKGHACPSHKQCPQLTKGIYALTKSIPKGIHALATSTMHNDAHFTQGINAQSRCTHQKGTTMPSAQARIRGSHALSTRKMHTSKQYCLDLQDVPLFVSHQALLTSVDAKNEQVFMHSALLQCLNISYCIWCI